MNGQDITRSVIRLELTRALRGMESSPKRTLRKLADLGKLCAKGTIQKEMFGIFQKRLKNPDSPYFSSIETLVKQVSGDALLTFGMNLGYNSWTYGVRRLRETPLPMCKPRFPFLVCFLFQRMAPGIQKV